MLKMTAQGFRSWAFLALTGSALLLPFAAIGCEQDIAEYEGPGGEEVEVEREPDGDIEVEEE